MQASLQERLLSAIGTAIIVLLLGYVLFLGMNVEIGVRRDQAMALIGIRLPQPPPPKRPVVRPNSTKTSGRASPRNLRNKATPIVAPPLVLPPRPSPVIVAPVAGTGMAASSGASDRPGPGQGAGGEGNGSGSGGSGDGDGDGDVPPRQIKGRLKSSDLPADLDHGTFSGTVSVRYHVEVDGAVSDCQIAGSSGNRELDERTCELIQQRFRFKPAHDQQGHPFRSTIEEDHHWEIDVDPNERNP